MSSDYLRTRDLVFVDTETGGLDASCDALLSVAAIRTDPSGRKIYGQLERGEIAYDDFLALSVHSEAVAVNGYTREKWASLGARSESAVLTDLRLLLNGAVWVGHNPHFDRAFIDAAMQRQNQTYKLAWRDLVDTGDLAWPLVTLGVIEDRKLQTIAKALHIEPGEAHSAYADAETSRRVYLAMLSCFRLGAIENGIVSISGEAGDPRGGSRS